MCWCHCFVFHLSCLLSLWKILKIIWGLLLHHLAIFCLLLSPIRVLTELLKFLLLFITFKCPQEQDNISELYQCIFASFLSFMDYLQDQLIMKRHIYQVFIWFDIILKCTQTTVIPSPASTTLPSSVEKLDILLWVHSLCPAQFFPFFSLRRLVPQFSAFLPPIFFQQNLSACV